MAIKDACEHYLEEEKELKERMKQLEADLYTEKVSRSQDVNKLKSQIQDWEFKYTADVDAIQTEYSKLLKFTDIER